MEKVCIGKIVNTHGIKGEIRLLSDFKFKAKVFIAGMKIYIGNSLKEEVITSYRPHKQFDMICLKGYTNINEVLKYKGSLVYVNREDLNLKKDEYLDSDLIGLTVLVNEKKVGTVKKIEKYPKNKLILVENEQKEFLIPYVSDIIEEININEHYMSIKEIKGLI